MTTGYGAGFALTLAGSAVAWAILLLVAGRRAGHLANLWRDHALRLAGAAVAATAFMAVWLTAGDGPTSLDRAVIDAIAPTATAFPALLKAVLALPTWTAPLALAGLLSPLAARTTAARWRFLAAGPALLLVHLLAQGNARRTTPLPAVAHAYWPGLPDATATLVVGLAVVVALAARDDALAPWAGRWATRLAPLVPVLLVAPVLVGAAWPTDVLAGVALAVAWVLTCDVVLSWTPRVAAHLPSLAGNAPWIAIIAIGVALRIATLWTQQLGPDGQIYAVMGNQLLHTGGFTMPWGGIYDGNGTATVSQHYPPAYPTILAGAYAVAGFSQAATHAVAILTGVLALVVVYACTRDLRSHRAALVTTALIAIGPFFIRNTGNGYSENLILLLFTATLWAILKSLETPWYIVPAGGLAGLGYLSKSSIGYFFIIAGLGGLAWRLRFRGVAVLRDKYYLGAIALFGACVAAWASRNLVQHGTWQTSSHLTAAYQTAVAAPLDWGLRSAFLAVYFAVAAYGVVLGAAPWLTRLRAVPLLDDEHDSGLWLAALLPLVLTSLIEAAIWMHEGTFLLESVRYLLFVVVPLAWLVTRERTPRDEPAPERSGHVLPRHVALLATTILLVTGAAAYSIPGPATPDEQINAALQEHLADGDALAFVGDWGIYQYYLGATDDASREVTVTVADDAMAAISAGPIASDWMLVQGDPGRVPGYDVVVSFGDPELPWAVLLGAAQVPVTSTADGAA